MSLPRVLLINPAIYDFTAYDFWLKPYGLLRIAGMLRGQAVIKLFDFLDRNHPALPPAKPASKQGCGRYYAVEIDKPRIFNAIPRRYFRFGVPLTDFNLFLQRESCFDFVLLASSMTYWYPGIRELLPLIKAHSPACKIIIGGVYATICHQHAEGLGADLIVKGSNLDPLWNLFEFEPNQNQPAFWEGYQKLDSAVIKLTEGCPMRCTYCSVPKFEPNFKARQLKPLYSEMSLLAQQQVKNIAFYDDALLADSKNILFPFLEKLTAEKLFFNFHTPNALHARFLCRETAGLLLRSGFKRIYLGFESRAREWLSATGSKLAGNEFQTAVENLLSAGARKQDLTAYLVFGHPKSDRQQIEESINAAHSLGIKIMLSDFSPIPETEDGELCRSLVDLDEPLWHNKTAFPYIALGEASVRKYKQMVQQLNRNLTV